MSRGVFIAAMVVVLAVGVAALLLLRGGGTDDSTFGPVIEFDPARLSEIRLTSPDTVPERILRTPDGEWRYQDPETGWAINPERLRAALELVREAKGESTTKPDPGFTPARTVIFVLEGGREIAVDLPATTLAGRATMRVREYDSTPTIVGDGTQQGKPVKVAVQRSSPTRMVVGDGVFLAIFRAGLGEWRDPRLFPGLGPDVSRITLDAGETRVVLTRTRSAWALVEPVRVPASVPAVERLLATLAALHSTRFIPEGDLTASQTGLDAPAGIIEVVLARRTQTDGGIRSEDVTSRLRLGSATDLLGDGRFAEIERGGRHLVVTSRSILERLVITPTEYISRRTLHVARADVAGLSLLPAEDTTPLGADARPAFIRTRDRWSARTEDAPPVPLNDEQARAVADLLSELCEADAAAIRLARPASYMPMARVLVFDAAGSPLEDFELAVSRGDGSEGGIADRWVLTTKLGGVYRLYSPGAGAKGLEWVRSIVPRAPPSPP